jgi:peptidoglycan/xylan/chitin deacetylase (PgdA/CDA1 family)
MRDNVNPVYPIVLIRTLQACLLAAALHWGLHWPFTGPRALGLFFTPLLCLYFVYVFVAPWGWGMPILTRLRTQERVLALTFDDGPSPETTPRVLDILRAHGAIATFFVLGEAAERHPELVRRITQEGHAVGLHGYRHRALVLASARVLRDEIDRAAAAVHRACPHSVPTLFRPPHGFKTLVMPFQLQRLGYRLASWSLNPRDYGVQTAAETARAFRDALHPGAVCLLHDGAMNARTVEALPMILAETRAAGYRCVPLSVPKTDLSLQQATRDLRE